MPRLTCCVSACKSYSQKGSGITFIKFPEDKVLQVEWRLAIGRGADFVLTPNTRICSNHFKSGQRSLNPNSEDFIPSVFDIPQNQTSPEKQKSYCKTCRKVTVNCPCKLRSQQVEESEEEEEEEGQEVGQEGEGQEGEEQEGEEQEVEGEEQDEDDQEVEDEAEFQDQDDEEEEVLDDGQVLDSDDDDWTPSAGDIDVKVRRSTRRGKKRRHSSSESSEEESDPESPPPPPPPKPKASPVKEKLPKVEKEILVKEVVVTPKATPSPRGRGRQPAMASTAVEAMPTPTSTTSDLASPAAKVNSNATPINKRGSGAMKFVPTTSMTHESRYEERIKELETEHSRKIETMQRNYNMMIANLKEDFTQKIHKMKVAWEIEKTNLQTEIEYYKENVQE